MPCTLFIALSLGWSHPVGFPASEAPLALIAARDPGPSPELVVVIDSAAPRGWRVVSIEETPTETSLPGAESPSITTAVPSASSKQDAPETEVTSPNPELAVSPKEEPLDLEDDELLPGVARPAREVWLSFPIDGTLKELLVKEGDRIEESAIIGRLDDELPRAAVAAAKAATTREAGVLSAHLEAALAKSYLARLERSHARGATSAAAVDEARSRVEKAGALLKAEQERLDQARLNLDVEQVRLDRHTMKAPFAGTVVAIPVTPGQTLTPTTPCLQLVANDRLRAEVHVPARLHGHLKVGARVPLRAGIPVSKTIPGTLSTVDPVLDPRTGTFRCVFEIDNGELGLPAGFTVIPILPGK